MDDEDGKVVTIESIVEERHQFETMHPLESGSNTITELGKRFDGLRDRGQSYAATSEYNGESVVVYGYWVGPFEGFSISSNASGQGGQYLLMKPGPNFFKTSSPLDKIIPRFLLRDPVLLEHDDYIKVSGVYHGTGYGEPGRVLESVNWLEFIRIERWDRENKCWQTAGSW